MSSDESQSEAQFNLKCLGGIKTGYRAENNIYFNKTSSKSIFVYIALLYPPNVLRSKAMLVCYQLVIPHPGFFFKGVLGTQFRSLESENIIIGPLE